VDRRLYLALLLFGATALTIWAIGLILAPFLVPIAWAMCLVTVTGGLYRRLSRRLGRPRLAAFVMTIATALAFVVPLVGVGSAIVREAASLTRKADGPVADKWEEFLARHERIADVRNQADRWLASFGTNFTQLREEAIGALGRPFTRGAVGVLSGVFALGFGFLVMLATLYFLYRDGEKIRTLAIDLSPMRVEETTRVLDTLRSTAFAAVVGGLATAVVQGTLGGIAFWITGVDAPVLWGFVMTVLSLLPVGGSALVWAPVMTYFFLDGHTAKGWFLLIWGVAVIGSSDNFLRPWLMRRAGAGEVHPLLLFFAIISGIGLFGVSGIVFGPLLVAFVLVVIRIFQENFGTRARADEAAAAVCAAGTASADTDPEATP
jgi:predicted PurR-regulated permease PerM